MRDVMVVKEKRDELKMELRRFEKLKERSFSDIPYKYMSGEDKNKFSYILSSINKLRDQINALEFVLNEDTELHDATRIFVRHYGFTKEELFREKPERPYTSMSWACDYE